jgi:hypothetical protein
VVRRAEREAAKCSLDPADIDLRARTATCRSAIASNQQFNYL